MKQVLTMINDYIVLIVAILGGILAILEKSSKIKFNPLSNLFRKAVKEETTKIIQPIEKEICILKKDVCKLGEEQKQYEARELRRYILVFASEIRNGDNKTNDEYEDFFRAVDRYEELIKSLKIKNGYVVNEVSYVKSKYNKI